MNPSEPQPNRDTGLRGRMSAATCRRASLGACDTTQRVPGNLAAAVPRWRAGSLVLLLALLPVGLTGCFKVSGDTKALRNSLTKSVTAGLDKQFEIGLGTLTLGLARSGLALVDLDPEARAALSAVHGVEVGVYQFHPGRGRLDQAAMLSAADKTMANRGWDRVVTVVSQRELVAVYVPKEIRSERNLKVCLVVLDGTQLVVAAARGNPEPLLEIALARVSHTDSGALTSRLW